MTTRIIYTNFWINSVQENLSLESQHLYIYLITCPYIGICSVFRLPDQYILLESKLTPTQLQKAKDELSNKDKVRFYDGWVYVVNAEKFVDYKQSPSNQVRYLKDVSFIPEVVLTKLSYIVDTSVDSTVDSSYKYKTINPNNKGNNKELDTDLIADEVDKALNDR